MVGAQTPPLDDEMSSDDPPSVKATCTRSLDAHHNKFIAGDNLALGTVFTLSPAHACSTDYACFALHRQELTIKNSTGTGKPMYHSGPGT